MRLWRGYGIWEIAPGRRGYGIWPVDPEGERSEVNVSDGSIFCEGGARWSGPWPEASARARWRGRVGLVEGEIEGD